MPKAKRQRFIVPGAVECQQALWPKLFKECEELRDRQNLAKEAADAPEGGRRFAVNGITMAEVARCGEEKRQQRGGFGERYMLVWGTPDILKRKKTKNDKLQLFY